MVRTISGYAAPILVAPILIWVLRPLFARFFRESAHLFLDVHCEPRQAQQVGSTMARINVVLFALIWMGVFTCIVFELKIAVSAAIVIAGLLIGFWLTTGIARHHLNIGGWNSVPVGLVSFAGGNLPMLLLIPVVLLVN